MINFFPADELDHHKMAHEAMVAIAVFYNVRDACVCDAPEQHQLRYLDTGSLSAGQRRPLLIIMGFQVV